MSFTSGIFLIGLLPWLIILFFLTNKIAPAKRILLLLINTLFYVWGGLGAFAFVFVFTLAVWLFCVIAAHLKNHFILGIMILAAVTPLLLVKYTSFVMGNINSFFHYELTVPSFIMPIGISFFTFEAISCIVDVYKEKYTGKISFLDIYLYLTFFVTVTSGPIFRFGDFKKGLAASASRGSYGPTLERIIIGLGKKLLVADKLAVLADMYFNGVADGKTFTTAGLWIGSAAYTLQLYFDFSGYSDIAIGLGSLMGFSIPENFDHPYRAGSIQDFWKRWHISLSRWFRDYIYIPLGGNRCAIPRHIFNMFVVWILTGIWHGADWAFILWGMGYFILLIAEKYVPFMKHWDGHWYGHIYALFFINLLWVPFRAANIGTGLRYLAGMFGKNALPGLESVTVSFLPFLVLAAVLCGPWNRLAERLQDKVWFHLLKGIFLSALFFLAVCAVVNATYSPYIYGNF